MNTSTSNKSPQDYAILVESVTKRYPKFKRYREMVLHPFRREEVTALRGVDLEVRKGELFGLLGVNGAGKTTLIKILCTLVLPNEGRAWVNGYDPLTQSWQIRGSIGYVISEERSFYWRLTGQQNLEFFSTLYNLDRTQAQKRIKSVLKLVGLDTAADQMFKDYSTGMRQKLAIARGLLTDPLILFMDEPTRSLDPLAAQHLRDFVVDEIVGNQGRTVFFSTHNLQEAEICQRIAILDQGKIQLCGTPGEIKERYSSPRYQLKLSYMKSGNVKEIISRLPWIKQVKALNGFYWEVELDSQSGSSSKLIEHLVQAQIKVEACSPMQATLQEVFQQLTSYQDDNK